MLTIAHNAVAASNRARTEALQRIPGIPVVRASLLTPPWWFEEGQKVDVTHSASWYVGRTLLTGNGTRYLYASGLARAMRAEHPDVIDLYEEPFSLVALQTLIARDVWAPNAALVFYSAVNVEQRWRWPYRAIEQLVLRRADAAHGPNSDVPRILRTKGFSNDKPAAVIPLGVDVTRFANAQEQQLEHIERPRIGFIGRFEAVKGLDVLLDAFQRLKTRASLVLAGDGSERPHLKPAANVHLLPPVAFEQVPSLLKALDVLVLPSVTILPRHREQFGRVLVEAMTAGVPVIGSSSGAIPEVIGDAGLIVPERDAAALANALDALLQDTTLRAEMIERGRERARSRFDWPVIARQTVELFQDAMAYKRQVVTA